MALFGKRAMGKLVVRMSYSPRYNFSMTLAIRELRISEPITFEGKTFEVPPGTYTLSLKGLMGDPEYRGGFGSGFRTAYGSFDRRLTVEVAPDQETICTFDLPKESLPVIIQVLWNREPLVGAEVMVPEADPNFRVIKEPAGIEFALPAGTYQVVVHRSAFLKDVIHVSEEETHFVLDLSRQTVVRTSRVVVRYLDGRMIKGTTNDFTPGADRFTVLTEKGEAVRVEGFAGMKAVLFVKTLEGDRLHQEEKDFAIASQFGRRTVVVFKDKEEMPGYTLPGQTEQPQFFLFPVDPKSNNAKVYVIREATTEIRFA